MPAFVRESTVRTCRPRIVGLLVGVLGKVLHIVPVELDLLEAERLHVVALPFHFAEKEVELVIVPFPHGSVERKVAGLLLLLVEMHDDHLYGLRTLGLQYLEPLVSADYIARLLVPDYWLDVPEPVDAVLYVSVLPVLGREVNTWIVWCGGYSLHLYLPDLNAHP